MIISDVYHLYHSVLFQIRCKKKWGSCQHLLATENKWGTYKSDQWDRRAFRFFFFFLAVLVFEVRVSLWQGTKGSTSWVMSPDLFALVILEIGSCFLLNLTLNLIFLISVSQIARITCMSHHKCPDRSFSLTEFSSLSLTSFFYSLKESIKDGRIRSVFCVFRRGCLLLPLQ
jgi:hypothetical protein